MRAYPSLSLKAAREKRDKLATEAAKDKSPASEKRLAQAGLSSNTTVREFGETYYKEQVVQAWKDPKAIRRYLDKEIFSALGEKVMKNVNTLDVQSLVYRSANRFRHLLTVGMEAASSQAAC